MATRLYLYTASHPTKTTSAGSSIWTNTTYASRNHLAKTTRDGGETSTEYGNAADSDKNAGAYLNYQAISALPLATDVINISSAVACYARGRQSNNGNNLYFRWAVWLMNPDGSKSSDIVYGDSSTEYTTSSVNRGTSANTASELPNCAGKYLVIDFGMQGDPSGGGDGHRGYQYAGCPSATTDLPANESETNNYNPWLEFAQNLSFGEAPRNASTSESESVTDVPTVLIPQNKPETFESETVQEYLNARLSLGAITSESISVGDEASASRGEGGIPLNAVTHDYIGSCGEDNFGRGDGGLGSDWTQLAPTLAIESGQVKGTDTYTCASYYNVRQPGISQWAEITIKGFQGAAGPGVVCRAAAGRYYLLRYDDTNKCVWIAHYFGGSFISESDFAKACVVGDRLKLVCLGNRQIAYVNNVYVGETAFTDNNTGYAGIAIYNDVSASTDARADEFSCGELDLDTVVTNLPLNAFTYDEESVQDTAQAGVSLNIFPSVQLGVDDFNRSDLGSAWTTEAGSFAINASDNVYVTDVDTAKISHSYRNDLGASFSRDQYAECKFDSTTFYSYIGPAILIGNGGGFGANGYTNGLYLDRYTSSGLSYTHLFELNPGVSAGDVVRVAMMNGYLYLYKNGIKVAGPITPGQNYFGPPGICGRRPGNGTNANIDDWAAGYLLGDTVNIIEYVNVTLSLNVSVFDSCTVGDVASADEGEAPPAALEASTFDSIAVEDVADVRLSLSASTSDIVSAIDVINESYNDNFNRTLLGDNWVQYRGEVILDGEKFTYGNLDNWQTARWVKGTFENDQFAEFTFRGGNGGEQGIAVRMSDTGGYFFSFRGVGNGQTYVGQAHSNWQGQNIWMNGDSYPWADGDKARIEVRGQTVRVFRNGIQIGSDYTGTLYTSGASGIAGGWSATPAVYGDNWIGGNLSTQSVKLSIGVSVFDSEAVEDSATPLLPHLDISIFESESIAEDIQWTVEGGEEPSVLNASTYDEESVVDIVSMQGLLLSIDTFDIETVEDIVGLYLPLNVSIYDITYVQEDYTDNFNRADEYPLVDPWRVIPGGESCQIISNALRGHHPIISENALNRPLSANQYAQCKVVSFGGALVASISLWLRARDAGAAYAIMWYTADNTLRLYKYPDDGGPTQLAGVSHIPVAGDILRAEVRGNDRASIKVYANGNILLTHTDYSSPWLQGDVWIGIGGNGTNNIIDDVECGNLVTSVELSPYEAVVSESESALDSASAQMGTWIPSVSDSETVEEFISVLVPHLEASTSDSESVSDIAAGFISTLYAFVYETENVEDEASGSASGLPPSPSVYDSCTVGESVIASVSLRAFTFDSESVVDAIPNVPSPSLSISIFDTVIVDDNGGKSIGDDFERHEIGPNWSGTVQIIEDRLATGTIGGTTTNVGRFTGATWGEDQEIKVVLSDHVGDTGPAARLNAAGAGYTVLWYSSFGGFYRIHRSVGSLKDWDSAGGYSPAAGDILIFTVTGHAAATTLTLKRNGSTIISASDNDGGAPGALPPGFQAYSTYIGIDSWNAQDGTPCVIVRLSVGASVSDTENVEESVGAGVNPLSVSTYDTESVVDSAAAKTSALIASTYESESVQDVASARLSLYAVTFDTVTSQDVVTGLVVKQLLASAFDSVTVGEFLGAQLNPEEGTYVSTFDVCSVGELAVAALVNYELEKRPAFRPPRDLVYYAQKNDKQLVHNPDRNLDFSPPRKQEFNCVS